MVHRHWDDEPDRTPLFLLILVIILLIITGGV
jgi:hypothetical protein